MDHELQLPIGADGLKHRHRLALTCGADRGRAASWPPSGADVAVASHPLLLGEHDQCTPGLSARLGSWELIDAPMLYKASVLLVGAVPRALGSETRPLHHLAHRRQFQHNVEVAFNKSADDAKHP